MYHGCDYATLAMRGRLKNNPKLQNRNLTTKSSLVSNPEHPFRELVLHLSKICSQCILGSTDRVGTV